MRHAEGASAVRSTEASAQPVARRPERSEGHAQNNYALNKPIKNSFNTLDFLQTKRVVFYLPLNRGFLFSLKAFTPSL
ncbi:MAG: hypothetical protein NZ455_04865 [Bacteroidia bacterium]|nr:hypothetical protein [Bacteroidia bacterium]MDW8347619.1 hypothetical protein [Bacteroidia bacterium]